MMKRTKKTQTESLTPNQRLSRRVGYPNLQALLGPDWAAAISECYSDDPSVPAVTNSRRHVLQQANDELLRELGGGRGIGGIVLEFLQHPDLAAPQRLMLLSRSLLLGLQVDVAKRKRQQAAVRSELDRLSNLEGRELERALNGLIPRPSKSPRSCPAQR